MSKSIGETVRTNALGLVAIFIALTGTAIAAQTAATNSVVSKSIKNGQVKKPDLAANAVQGSANVLDETLTGADVLDDSLAASDLAPDSVGSSEVAPDALTSADLASDAAGASEVAPNAIGGSEMADNAVASAEVVPESLGAADLGVGSVGLSEIASNAVNLQHMADNSVGSAEVFPLSLRMGDLAVGVTDESNANVAGTINATACSGGFNDGLEFGAAPVGSHTLVYHVRLTSGAVNPGWTMDGLTTTTVDSGRVRVCNNTPFDADPPDLTFSYMTIAP
jgi:hypothetical protein